MRTFMGKPYTWETGFRTGLEAEKTEAIENIVSCTSDERKFAVDLLLDIIQTQMIFNELCEAGWIKKVDKINLQPKEYA